MPTRTGDSIYIGIDDNEIIVGLTDLDKTMLNLGNMLRDSINPNVMMFIEINTDRIASKNIIHICVTEGTNKPYYIIQKGIKHLQVSLYGKAVHRCQLLMNKSVKW